MAAPSNCSRPAKKKARCTIKSSFQKPHTCFQSKIKDSNLLWFWQSTGTNLKTLRAHGSRDWEGDVRRQAESGILTTIINWNVSLLTLGGSLSFGPIKKKESAPADGRAHGGDGCETKPIYSHKQNQSCLKEKNSLRELTRQIIWTPPALANWWVGDSWVFWEEARCQKCSHLYWGDVTCPHMFALSCF